jgi:hypothetical protein
MRQRLRVRWLLCASIFLVTGIDPTLIYAQASRLCDAKLDFTRVTVNPKPGHSIAMGAAWFGR